MPAHGDPAREGLLTGYPVSVVGVEFHTRRRNRMNGRITRSDEAGFEIQVDQSYGNCPQYIQTRQPNEGREALIGRAVRLEQVDNETLRIIEAADTCFIASVSSNSDPTGANQGVDVNHRGGRPGFLSLVRSGEEMTVSFPDFVGNFFFNTLGNIAVNPVAGLLIPDFATGSAISLTGRARIVWEGDRLENFAGAERLVEIAIDHLYRLEDVIPKEWSNPVEAPQLARTGTWREVDEALLLKAQASRSLRLRVAAITEECEGVRSYELIPDQASSLPSYKPGQFLPVILNRGPDVPPLRAVYSLSRSADSRSYRISVARTREVTRDSASHWLHDSVQIGTTVDALSPRGTFVLDPDSSRSVLFIAGGIGITPLFAMIDHLTGGTPDRCRFPDRTVVLIHSVKNSACHPLKEEILARARARDNFFPLFAHTAPSEQDRLTGGFAVAGRLNRRALRTLLPLDDYDVYLCGPSSFMQDIYDALRSLGVADARVRAEAFGQSSLRPSGGTTDPERAPLPAVQGARIHFRKSNVHTVWTGANNLLELAESLGIDAPYGCRSGKCGECAVPLSSGRVDYGARIRQPKNGLALTCCAYPADAEISLDL